MASPFPASVQTAAAQLGIDVSVLGDQEVEILLQILATEVAIVEGGGGGGGATIPATTNLIKGDGAGNGADSGIVPSTVILGAAGSTANAVMVATGSGNEIKPAVAFITAANAFVPATDNSQDIGELFPGKRWLNGYFSGTLRGEVNVQGTLFIGTGGWYIYNIGDGIARITNSAGTDFDRFQLGGTTSSFPALKRNATGIDIVLADSSGPAPLSGSILKGYNSDGTKSISITHDGTNGVIAVSTGVVSIASGTAFRLGVAATTGLVAGALAALTTSSIVIQDNTGTSYRVPCITP